MTNTNTDSKANRLRAALKAAGFNARAVSVRHEHYSMGSTIHVTIMRAGIRLADVEKIASEFESVSRCSVTGEILNGGNTYLRVQHDRRVADAAREAVLANLWLIPTGQSLQIPTDAAGLVDPVTFAVVPSYYTVRVLDDHDVRVEGLPGWHYRPTMGRAEVAGLLARALLALGAASIRSVAGMLAPPSLARPIAVAAPSDGWIDSLDLG